MQLFVQALQSRVTSWKEAGYAGIYPETRNILAHIKSNNFLHEPQREALETYIYLKEVLDNRSVPQIVAEYADSDTDFLKVLGFEQGVIELWSDLSPEKRTERIQKQLAGLGFAEYGYANFVLALTMGSGKTILMGTLMMYEFIVSFNHPDDTRFAKNVLVFGPADTGIVEVLKEIKTFDYSTVIPREYEDILLNIKYWYLEKPETPLNPLGNYNVIVSNSSKIILRNWSDVNKGNRLFELRKETANKRLTAIQQLENLAVFVDEAHHSYGEDVSKKLNQSRKTIHHLAENTNVVTVANLTGTPYVKNVMLPDTVYTFSLQHGIEKGILKQVTVSNHGSSNEVQSEDFVNSVVDMFWKEYGDTRIAEKLPKIAFYTTDITMLEQLEENLDKALQRLHIPLSKKIVWHSTYTGEKKKDADYEFNRLDTPESEKQFILLVNKGTEGWNCKSLVAVALYKNSTSNNFVLQASCRCLRRIGDNSVKARVFLSDENYKVLNRELENNFNTDISQLTGKVQNEVQVDLVVEKRRTVEINRKLVEILSSSNIKPSNIKIDLKKTPPKKTIPLIQEREISLSDDGKAVYRDPISVQSADTETQERSFGYYDIVALLQQKTHLSFTAINEIFEANKITRDALVKAVEKNYLVVHGIVNQILEQAISYEQKETIKTELLELTKAFPFKINVKRELHETDTEAFARSLLIYREQEEANGHKSQFGFHVNPYNFDSTDELEIFKYLRQGLRDNEAVSDVYFTGGITNEKHNEFFFEYWNPAEERVSKYFPDFLVETTSGRYLVLEVKDDRAETKLAYENDKKRYRKGSITKDQLSSIVYAKEVGFDEFKALNKNFEYHIVFNGTVASNQQEVLEKIVKNKRG
ncbi:DEAD/DEAH box helicase family protein [Candidatus Kaiserbacteria bacterium]|nr:DEAD/DEAH box helicase family protein [Candidatus Kaiserbacteria bacterium]USN92061.1 MAG: DEAD/DEAH box helicase family protein [Candidatus Nomurabacteria bacterium]